MVKPLWTTSDTHALINHMESNFTLYTTGVKQTFYGSFVSYSATEFTREQVKTKCQELERKYKSWHDKFQASGFGLEETEGDSIADMLGTKFPYYYRMEDILGSRPNVTPPVLLELGTLPTSERTSTPSSSTPTNDEVDTDHHDAVLEEDIALIDGSVRCPLTPRVPRDQVQTQTLSVESSLKKRKTTREPTLAELILQSDTKKIEARREEKILELEAVKQHEKRRMDLDERRLLLEEKKMEKDDIPPKRIIRDDPYYTAEENIIYRRREFFVPGIRA
jgi:hypothetical protein